MSRIVWSRLVHRKTAAISMLIALISIYTLIPFGLQQAKEAKTTVRRSIEQHGRGTYDLLVRPASSRTKVEKALGVVEENYIGDGKGGISIAEWKRLKADPMIDVAAPVASLGYFRGKRLSLELPVLKHPTRFTYQFYTSDGYKKYPIGQAGTFIYFEQAGPGLIQYLADPSAQPSVSSAAMMILLPDNYYLLAAIDPDSEQRLTGIDFSELKKPLELDNGQDPRMAMLKAMLENYGNPPIVKVLQRDDLNIPLFLRLNVDTLHVNADDYVRQLHLAKGQWLMAAERERIGPVLKELETKQAVQSETMELDLSKFQKPFDGTALRLDEQWQLSPARRHMADSDTSVYYVASKMTYHHLDSIPSVNIVKPGEPPSYKHVEKRGVSMTGRAKIPFFIEQVGTFSPKAVSRHKLAASPLGIYGEMEAKTESGLTLTPTTIPGSFIPAPASGVTTLEAAELIKGTKPIDAIRIRIAGIQTYDEAARRKIEKVATKLLKQGYEVDVVAGASFKEMTLAVEGIGKVKESWTTLGVAQQLTYTWNHMNVLTTVLFSVFAMLWIVTRLAFEKNVLTIENEWLALLGWREERIRYRNRIEQFGMMTAAFVVSLGILSLWDASWPSYGMAVGLWAFSMMMAVYLLQRKEKKQARAVAYRHFPSLLYYRRWIVPTAGILLLSAVLMMVQVSALTSALQTTGATALGEYVKEATFWFQIAVIASAVYLAITGVSEGINTLLSERKSEFQMYHMIGWSRTRVLRHFAKEIAAWSLMAMGIGFALASIALYAMRVPFVWIIVGAGSSCFIFALIIAAIVWTRRFAA